ncbi:MAG: Rv3235 family protein [Gemmatimonas sp.]
MSFLDLTRLARLGLAGLLLGTPEVSAQTGLVGVWRVERGVAAPWVREGVDRADAAAWLGSTVRFQAAQVTGPGVLSCRGARYVSVAQPADGLFQGGLPSPARESAGRLGITQFPVPGVRLDCDAGSFDFHAVDRTTMLVAVDHVIWTLTRSPGALAAATSPSGVVQRFLEQHFAGSMAFDQADISAKRSWLSDSLSTALTQALARRTPVGEAPLIDGDVFTDSQEPPTRFAVGTAVPRNGVMTVSVRLSDGHRDRTVAYRLHRQRGEWRIANLRFDDGSWLLELLRRTR